MLKKFKKLFSREPQTDGRESSQKTTDAIKGKPLFIASGNVVYYDDGHYGEVRSKKLNPNTITSKDLKSMECIKK